MIKKEDYSTNFENLNALSQSSFAIIYEGNDKNMNESKALKIYEKGRVKAFLKGKLKRNPTEKDLQIYYDAFKNEATNMNILQGINKENKNAVILDNCYETDKQFAIVMEKCDNNLFNHLADRKEPFNSEEIYEILTQLNNSFKIMFENKILHRAIKPQNILLKYLNNERTKFTVKLKITDDSCTSSNSSKFLDSNFGRNYRIYAPEVLNEKDFTEESDLWSLGILIYTLYFKVFPFDGNSRENVLSNITEDAIKNLKKCENIDLNNLIRELLIIEPNKRISWDDYFIHPFFKKKMDFREFYDFNQSDFLGFSKYANIYKGKVKDKNGKVKDKNGKEKAIKIMDKTLIKSQLQNQYDFDNKKIDEELKKIIKGFYNEVNHMEILQGLNNENQNTVIFDEYFNTNKEFVIIMELCNDNLLDYFLREKERKHKLTPEEIHDIISQLNNSFRIMDEKKILHRALIPQNILMKYLNEEKTKFIVKLKLTDDSGILNSSNNLLSQNTISDDNLRFYAPEVLEKGIFTEKSDLFSLGVLIYNLYFDEYPFEGQNKEEILNKIAKGIIKKTNNPEFDDLLEKLLNGNKEKRISWEDYFEHIFFRINQDYKKYYEIGEKLGESGYGVIYKAKNKITEEMKAIKIVNRNTIINHWKNNAKEIRQPNDNDLKSYYEGFFNEVNNMKILQGINNENQNTTIFNEFFNTRENFAYVMELCDGNLLDYIKDKNLNIKEIKDILIQLNNSFAIMHKNKILHRAIKPENVLIKKVNNSILYKLKLTDNCCLLKDASKIEMSNIYLNNNLCISAPEVLKGEKFKEESDLWSLGILIYYLKFKNYPFNGKNKKEILTQIENGLKQKSTENWVFDDLLKNLLIADSKKRMSWRTYFNHSFFK